MKMENQENPPIGENVLFWKNGKWHIGVFVKVQYTIFFQYRWHSHMYGEGSYFLEVDFWQPLPKNPLNPLNP